MDAASPLLESRLERGLLLVQKFVNLSWLLLDKRLASGMVSLVVYEVITIVFDDDKAIVTPFNQNVCETIPFKFILLY